MNPLYKKSFWRQHKRHFDAWKHGRTGGPLVDAGMQQLWETGWMHNRVRMIVASFLTKNLGIGWQQGADWFRDTLVDAAPYYRVFNPQTQAKRFDVKGEQEA